MRSCLPRLTTLVAGAASAVMLMAPAAQAATDTTQFGVTGGGLQLPTAPDVPNLGTVVLDGTLQVTNATMSNWTARDATGTGNGWNLNVQGDTAGGKSPVFKEYCLDSVSPCAGVGYVSGGATLAANSLTLSNDGATVAPANGSPGGANLPTLSCSSACNVDAASAVKIASAAVNAGMGTFNASSYGSASLGLTTPTTTKALPSNKVYRVDLLWTLSTGP